MHGDDFTSAEMLDQLRWFETELAKAYAIKTKFASHDKDLPSEGRVLNRVLRATEDGWKLEADHRHAELVQEEFDVANGKALSRLASVTIRTSKQICWCEDRSAKFVP